MTYFLNFIKSGEHFSYVFSSYCIVFLILCLIFMVSFIKTKRLERELTTISRNETKK